MTWEWKEGNEIEADGVVVAFVLGADFGAEDLLPTDEMLAKCNARARLIAAAPDLLAACRQLLYDFSDLPERFEKASASRVAARKLLEAAAAAVHKASGD